MLILLAAAPAAAHDRLDAARRAAFPDGTTIRDGIETVRHERSVLVDAPFGPVLVSGGEVLQDLNGRPFTASHGTEGRVLVHYLRAAGHGFRVMRTFPRAAENGSFGSMSHWSVSRLFTNLPAIYTEGGGTWQGYTCSVASLTELRPSGPVEVAVIPIYSDNEGTVESGRPRRLEGRIANIRRGRSFDVVFSGSARFTEHYVYRGGRFVRTSRESRATC